MGRPPSNGAPSFRFNPAEVAQMEDILTKHEGQVPSRDLLVALAERFSNSPERAGKTVVQMKQVWNWFQNRRYALRAKSETPGKPASASATRDTPMRNVPSVPQQMAHSSGPRVVGNISEAPVLEFEAKSARDGAWYDVQLFLSMKNLETSSPEALIRFAGFGPEEDEWVNVHKHVRQRSLPCEASECYVVAPGDLILCFQEGKEQALYFDAHVLDAQRRRHDVRGCRCRFLVRYDHDQSEEIVPLRKICRRPETDYRLQHVANETARSTSMSAEPPNPVVNLTSTTTSGITNPNPGSVSITVSPSPIISAGPSLRPPAPIQATITATNPTFVQAPTPSITGPSGATTSPIVLPAPTTKPISAMVSGRVPVVDTQTPAPFAEQKNVTVTGSISGPVTEMVTETPPFPEQEKAESDKPAQIPIPALEKVDCANLAQIAMPDMKKFETDNSGQISVPVCEKVEVLEGDNPAQVSVPYQKKVEGDNVVAQVSVPDLKKVESDNTLAQISEADLKKDESDYPAQVQATGPKDVESGNDPALISSPRMNKAESGNLAQIPKPVPEADKVETVDPTPVVAPEFDMAESNNPVSVLEPNKVEAKNPAPVSASEVNNADTDNPTPLPALNKVESDLPIAAPEPNKADSVDLGTPDVEQKAENTANAETHHEAETMLTDTETAKPTGPTEM